MKIKITVQARNRKIVDTIEVNDVFIRYAEAQDPVSGVTELIETYVRNWEQENIKFSIDLKEDKNESDVTSETIEVAESIVANNEDEADTLQDAF